MADSCSEFSIKSTGPDDTRAMGEIVGRLAQPGDVILLNGNLGAGKTCFTQGIARGLKINAPVQSPTFVLAREMYGRLPLYHIDLYRLDNTGEIEDLGLDDYFFGQGVTVVEWAEKGSDLLLGQNLHIMIQTLNESVRVLTFLPSNYHYREIVSEIIRQCSYSR